MQSIEFDKRKSGIPLIGNLAWGTHLAHFYQTKNDLLDILVPYFHAGLENNEFCVWVTCAPLKPFDIEAALKIAVPNFHKYKHSGQIEIISCKGRPKSKQASCALIATKLNKVVSKNFDGLRFACCVSPGRNTKTGFSCYNVDSIAGYNVLAAFSYPRKNFDALGLMQVVKKHHFALVRNAARWELLESSEASRVKEALKKSEEKLHSVFSNMAEGFAYSRIVLDDKGEPSDLVFLEVNAAFERLTGLKAKKIIGRKVTEVLPGIEKDPAGWIAKFGQVAITGQPAHFENYAQALKKWYSVSVFSPQKGFFAVVFSDITALRESHEKLAAVNEELSASNEELSASNEELRAETEQRQRTEEILRDSQRAALNLMEDANAARLQVEKANVGLQREVAERKRAEEKIKHLASFPQHNPNPIIEISANGKVVFSNVSAIKALERLGVPKKTSLFLPEDFPRILKDLHLNKQTLYTHEIKIKDSTFVETLTVLPELKVVRIYARDITQRKIAEEALKEAHDTLELKVAKRTEELAEANRRLIKEIVERKEIERAVRLRGAVLKLMQRSVSRLEFLNTLVKFIKGLSGCRYCGIRVLNEEGEIPYEAYLGFSRSFWEKENWLSISHDQCACIRVVTGNALPQDKPCMSSGGSFVANDALGFVHSLNPEEKKLFRGVCMQNGFHSLAVIPVSYKNEVIAAIHLADERKDMLSQQKIGFLELLSPLIGEGIHKFDMEGRIRQSHIGQSIISSLLRYSFTEISLEKIFIRCLELLFSMNWLSTESKGGIYLAADEQDTLVLKAEKNLPEAVKKECAKIPHGKCYCGKTARDKKIYFSSAIDKDHEVTYAGMKPHGHYCVPILSGERLLGVINLYLPEKYRRDTRKEEFLMAVSSALSGIIQRRQAEEEVIKSSTRIANILEGITDGFIALNSDWRFTYVNAAAEAIMGVKRQEALGKIVWDVFPEAKKTRVYEDFHSSVMNKIPVSLEILDPRTNKWIEVYAYPSEEGLLAYFKDISEKKLSEEKLKETQDQLEQASRLSDIGTLAATVAHELRNPLAAIQMASYNIKRKAQNPLLDKHLLTIENKVNESEQIISNLLFYSRLRPPQHENINICESINECVTLVKRRFAKEKISLALNLGSIKKVSIQADPLQLKEVFCNILNNAYESQGKSDKRVEIKAEIENESVKFVIKDSGEGINKHDLERIFDPFFTTKARGTGLGLTVCKQVINLHGGSINIDSEKDIGTVVTVRLPIKKEAGQ